MYSPTSFEVALLLTWLSAICWGSWVNMFKGTRGYRFELFYWDYAVGIVICTFLIGVTLGSSGESGESFIINLSRGSTSNLVYALIGGVIWNAGNLLLVAAIDLSGMAVAFPIAAGIAIVEGVVLSYLLQPKGHVYLLGLGVLMAVVAVLFNAHAYRLLNKQWASGDVSTRTLGIKVSVISGILLGGFAPFITQAMTSERALTPYSAAFLFTVGAFLCCFVVNAYFMRRPLQGDPISLRDFWGTRPQNHLLGIGGGLIWGVGTCANFVAAGLIGVPISYAIGQSAPLIAAAWGVFAWHEFKNAESEAWRSLILMTVSFMLAVSLIALAYDN